MPGHAANRTCAPSNLNNNPGLAEAVSSSSPKKDARLHRHTQSLGLLSPIPSYAVLPRTPTPTRPSNLRLHPLTPLASHLDMATTTAPLSLTQPPSPTTPHHRPPSRSERLLRDTLKRDEQERLPTHRRRHSVNVSPHPTAQGGGEDNYARGTYLFRTAMNAPRVPSPSPSRHTFNHTLSHYYGSPEHEAQTRNYNHHQQRGPQRSPPRSPSPSPSSGRRKHSLHRSPLLPSSHGLSRQESVSQPGRPRGASQGKHRPPAVIVPPRPGEPMGMTPHEQVLRARLERVLSAGRIVSEGQAAQTTKKNSREEMRERERRRRSNEVRDEVDGWPWREREYDSRSLVSTPPHSSSSGSSSSNIPNQTQDHIQFQTHVRTRSKTDPIPPPTSSSVMASPKRNATAPTPPRARVDLQQQHQQSTPSRRSKHSQSRERDEDARLLTPPPTPPFFPQEYHPSPYPAKTRLTPRRPTHAPVPVHAAGPATPGGGECDDTCSTSSSSSLHSLPPYAYSPSIGQGHAQSVGGSPQFNARKASARCRAIEGYVSFASVEGLGEPAEVDDEEDEEERGRTRGRGSANAGGGVLVGALRRLLGGERRGVVV